MSESALFVQFFVGFLLSATGVHASSCPIKLSPTKVVVEYGGSVSVNCSTWEKDFEGMGWEAPQGGISLQEESSHLTWRVERLTDWTINPACFLNPSDGDQCSLRPKVVLYTFPETIHMSSSGDPSGVTYEREEYNITCDIYNVAPVQNLTVRWYKGDTLVETHTFDNKTKVPVNQSSVLSFTPARQDNGATFRCEAYMDLQPEGPLLNVTSEEFNVTVYFGPDVQCSTPELLEGDTLLRNCPVVGNPAPFVKWLKDGRPIDPSAPLSRKDAGLYTIEAKGASGINESLKVLILYGPELTCPSTYTAQEDAPHNLTCTVEGYPKPETFWYKDADEVELPRNLTRSDTGQYLITATNSLSSVNVTVDINVIYPPSPIVELEDSEVDVGSTMWLKCSSVGNPRPKYFWNYYQSDNVLEENEDGVSRLQIHNATPYNMGSYTCQAWNDRGNVSKTVRVTVKGAEPECPIKMTPDRMVVEYNSRAPNATCTAISSINLEEEIHWEVQEGLQFKSTSWSADTLKDWDPKPFCTAKFKGIGRCKKDLNFTLYKTPDTVSIRSVDNLRAVVEDGQIQLQCDVTNVAPARNLVVRWFIGNETFEPRGDTLLVTGCLPKMNAECNIESRSRVNVSSTISITLNRTHNSAEFRCEAQLDLGPEIQQPLLNLTSSPLTITVYSKPVINITKLPKTIPVFRGYPEELVCEADGHPTPRIQWLYSADKVPRLTNNTLIVSEAGFYNCSATNTVGAISYEVEVILKGKVAGSSCPVAIDPPSAVVKYGDKFSANCSSLSNKTEGMGWESSREGVPLQNGVTFVYLEIDEIIDWRFEPKCFINLADTDPDQCLEKLVVTAYQMPDSVAVTVSPVGPLVEGRHYHFLCEINNVAPALNLAVYWHIGNDIFHIEKFNDTDITPVNMTSSVKLEPKRINDGAQIWCEAKLDFGPTGPAPSPISSESHKVIVLYPPTFTDPEHETVEVASGSKITLNCTATGNPVPVYSWHFPHAIQKTGNSKQNMNQPVMTPSFDLPGTYNCTASNSQGTSTKSFTVVQAPGNRTVFGALLGGFVTLGVLLFICGFLFVTQDGTFSFCKGSYIRGQPTSSAPI